MASAILGVTAILGGAGAAKGVVNYDTTANKYPTRPSGFASVEWIGPSDPAVAGNIVDGVSIAIDGDTWVNNT